MGMTPDQDTLRQAMATAAEEIDQALDILLPTAEGPEAPLYAAMRYAAIGGGKRLRGFLVLEGARQFGVSRNAALRVAGAIEMVHAYSLVHDDLPAMDDDDLRRGKPTVHKAFDEATAILAGDALQTQAFMVLAERRHPSGHGGADRAGPLPVPRRRRPRHVRRPDAGHAGRGFRRRNGRSHHRPPADLEDRQADRISAEAGAVLGKAAAAQRHALLGYGRDLGAAFQIADDLLDATASAAEAGKRTGKDAEAGKATLVGLLGIDRARLHAERLVVQAKSHLDGFGERADLLRMLADFVIERRS